MTDDNLPDWPHDPEFDAELAAHRASEARGEIVRGNVRYDPERDFITRSALAAQLKDAHAMLREANQTIRELEKALAAQIKFNADLFRDVERLRTKQVELQQTLAALAQRLQ